ncbi:hypothetical protein H8356DRAFT_1419895 [Neocallimastix lanati (nom. inval.)]|nr:hypothetical protein H8356DRAFT_1419895 [Neocallimastix sp. JGI-2020a]
MNIKSTVSTSVFVDHFNNLTRQSSIIDKEPVVNNNDWVEKHQTILSTSNPSVFSGTKFRQKSQNSFSNSDLHRFNDRFNDSSSDISSTSTINFQIHKQEIHYLDLLSQFNHKTVKENSVNKNKLVEILTLRRL